MRRNKKVAAVAAGALVLGTAGVAYAYWTTTGSGSGSGSTTAGVSGQLGFSQASLDAMYPGDSAQDLTVTVTNNATESAYVATVKAYVTTDKTGCSGADFLLDGAPAPDNAMDAAALTWTAQDLAAGAHDEATGTIQFNNTGGNQDVCKSAAITIHYLAS